MAKCSEALTLQYSIDLKSCYWQIKVFPQNSYSALVTFLKQQLGPTRHFYSGRQGPDMWPAPPGLGETQIEDFAKKPLAEVPWHSSAQPLGPHSLLLSFPNSVSTHTVELNSLEIHGQCISKSHIGIHTHE